MITDGPQFLEQIRHSLNLVEHHEALGTAEHSGRGQRQGLSFVGDLEIEVNGRARPITCHLPGQRGLSYLPGSQYCDNRRLGEAGLH